MSKELFSEFDPVSAKQWKQKIQFDLKGADYNQALLWKSPEGIHVKPFYNKEDLGEGSASVPGHPENWLVGQLVFVDDEEKASNLVSHALENGAESLILRADAPFDFQLALRGIQDKGLTIYFELNFLSSSFVQDLIAFCDSNNIQGFFGIDIVGNLARTGNWFKDLRSDHEVMEAIVTKSPARSLAVHLDVYQNAGATAVQQLAYTLGHCVEYLNHFQGNPNLGMTFHLATGHHYFFEIAKIRALRKLFAAVASEFGIPGTCHIVATPSKRNKTLYDYNVNMLRTTTECMSAVLGGANTVYNQPYDAIYHKSNEFGERISRNQLLILKAESYFDTVANPSDGAYYIEALTDELAQQALELFKTIEAGGGFLKQLKEGTIQKKIKESAQKEQTAFNEGNRKLIGTNIFENKNDKMKENLELYPFVKTKVRKTLLEPIIEKRISETIEKQRLENE